MLVLRSCARFATPDYCTGARLTHYTSTHTHAHTSVLRPFYRDHAGERFFWTFMVQGKTEADIPTIRRGRHSIRANQRPTFVSSPLFFMTDALPATTLPLYPGLRQAPNILACIPSGVSVRQIDTKSTYHKWKINFVIQSHSETDRQSPIK